LPRFPIWDDVCTFDGLPWRGGVEVIAGGFPCQDISIAGKGAGIEGNRSGLWGEMARIIGEVRPPYVFVENTPALTFRGLGRVIGDLSEMGYGARWGVVGADDAGAPHIRKRIWILAVSNAQRLQGQRADSCPKGRQDEGRQAGLCRGAGVAWWDQDPAEGGNEAVGKLDRVAHGMAHRVDRLKAIGNGQVPQVARIAWDILSDLTEAKQPKQPEPEPHRKRDGSETEKRRKRVGSESEAI
jgi:DNA (cytosine-5)-methyltransferase 1